MFTWYIGLVSDMQGVLKELGSVYMVYRTCLRYVRCTKGVSVYISGISDLSQICKVY